MVYLDQELKFKIYHLPDTALRQFLCLVNSMIFPWL